jgi:hypothetical protein
MPARRAGTFHVRAGTFQVGPVTRTFRAGPAVNLKARRPDRALAGGTPRLGPRVGRPARMGPEDMGTTSMTSRSCDGSRFRTVSLPTSSRARPHGKGGSLRTTPRPPVSLARRRPGRPCPRSRHRSPRSESLLDHASAPDRRHDEGGARRRPRGCDRHRRRGRPLARWAVRDSESESVPTPPHRTSGTRDQSQTGHGAAHMTPSAAH